MAYRFEFNRFADIVVPVMEDSGIIFDYEMSVSTGGEHIASCCCDACEADPFEEHIRPDDVEYSDVDGSSFDAGLYINYGLNGYSNPFLDFSAVQIHEHDHGSKDDDGPLFSGVGD